MPNMMSIITSLYPESHGVFDAFKDELSSRVYTMAEILKIYGYKTAWFAELKTPHLDIDIGFGKGYDFKVKLGNKFEGKKQLLSWIKKNKNNRFFIAMNNRHMHAPYLPLSIYKNAFKTGTKGIIFDNYKDFYKAIFFNILKKINTPGSQMHALFDKKTIALINNLQNLTIYDTIYDKIFPKGSWERKVRKIESLIPQEKRYRIGQIHIETYNSTIDISNKENLEYLVSLYDACILGVDQELIRPIISTLKKLNIYDNTIIVITGDHGESLGEHGLLGHGHDFFDQLIHVPLIIKLPNSETNKEVMTLVQSIDLLPTIFDLLGVKIAYYVEGKSLFPLIQNGTTNTVNEYVYGQNRTRAYLRSPKWKLIVDRSELGKKRSNNDRLFDIKNDPEEMVDLQNSQIEVYNNLRGNIKEHLESLPIYVDKEYTFKPHIDRETQEKIKKTGYW